MQDISQGQERVRAWPQPRGKVKNQKTKDQMEWFWQAQFAAKVMDPRIMIWANETTAGTPLLPRDITTMMMAGRMIALVEPNGKVTHSVAFRTQVSESLDAITQEEGYIMIRQPEGWRGIPLSAVQAVGVLTGKSGNVSGSPYSQYNLVSWDAPSIDPLNMWDAGAPTKFTVQQAGWYDVSLYGQKYTGTASYLAMSINKNGNSITINSNRPDPATSNLHMQAFASDWFDEGDEITTGLYLNGSTAGWSNLRLAIRS